VIILLSAIAAAAAKPMATIPPAFQGDWVMSDVNCATFKPHDSKTETLQMLTIKTDNIINGELDGRVKKVQILSANRIKVETHYFNAADDLGIKKEIIRFNPKDKWLKIDEVQQGNKRLSKVPTDGPLVRYKKCP
jgi:hypothetical protein